MKILRLYRPKDHWFHNVLKYSGLASICCSGYTTISHGIQGAFVEIWNKQTLSFHFITDEMTITLDDVACLLHLHIRGKLLDNSRMKCDETQERMIIYLGVDPMDAMMQCESTKYAHAKFSYLEKLYGENLELAEYVDVDEL
ncbi:unnamed protein product [Lathyrus oleraceus]